MSKEGQPKDNVDLAWQNMWWSKNLTYVDWSSQGISKPTQNEEKRLLPRRV